MVEVSDRQRALPGAADAVRGAVEALLDREGVRADVSVALVDDAQMAELNSRYAGRPETTDVLAFPYGQEDGLLQGEVIVNAERAQAVAADRGGQAMGELMLYVVHGLLHLLGCDDHDPADARRMRERERQALGALGYGPQF